MERIKKIILIIFILIFSPIYSYSDNATTNTPTQVQSINECIKTFPIDYEKLYYLTLSGLNEFNYKINEIQSRGGYILFNVNNREFLATIIYVSATKSMLKITPVDCKYNFSNTLPQNIFKYIENYQNKSY